MTSEEKAMRVQIGSDCSMEYDEAGQGRALVLLHAFPLSRAMWRDQVEGLRDVARVIVPDLRGFGGTTGFTDAPSLDRMADDVAELLQALNVTAPVVGGLSMGGYVALAYARRHADRLGGLILADTRSGPDTPEGKTGRNEMIEFARSHTASDVIDKMMPKMVSEQTRKQTPEVVEAVRRLAAAQSVEGIVGALQVLRDRPDAGPFLARIAVPTLVIVGSEDALTPPAMSQELASAIRGARLETIEGAGHLSSMEQPAAFNALVRSFLQTMSPGS
jgi:3-oxoadipate enol-lactonase